MSFSFRFRDPSSEAARPLNRRLVSALLALALLIPALGAPARASAQTAAGDPPADSVVTGTQVRPANIPFGPGERADYRVSLGIFGTVGKGYMEVVGVEDVDGHDTYHLRMSTKGGVLFAKVNDQLDSWMDVKGLFSRRFTQDQHEVSYKRHRQFDFFPAQMRWEVKDFRSGNTDSGELPVDAPLDDVSFLYFVRTLRLEVGETYVFDRYFKKDGNPVTLRVLRRDTIKVDAGTFPVIVVQPIIKTGGLFGEGGHAEVYFSDDDRRLVVELKSSVPVIGSLNMYLKDYKPGLMTIKPLGEPIRSRQTVDRPLSPPPPR